MDSSKTGSVHRGAYYQKKLSAKKLVRCYEQAPPRIKQYLNAEIQQVISSLRPTDVVLELGCGFGRAMKIVSPFVSWIVGNDISKESLKLAKSHVGKCRNCTLFLMDASQMAFDSCVFDAVFCIQNGISAFGIDKKSLMAESLRVAKVGGIVLFSSYSPKIWAARLKWFRRQSQLGLIGEIDEQKTHNGIIACKDGFTATTISRKQFAELSDELRSDASIIEVDESSIFCKLTKK